MKRRASERYGIADAARRAALNGFRMEKRKITPKSAAIAKIKLLTLAIIFAIGHPIPT
jgi:hypothetical protein